MDNTEVMAHFAEKVDAMKVGEDIYFEARGLCNELGISNSDEVLGKLESSQIVRVITSSLEGEIARVCEIWYVTESGLYVLLLEHCDNPIAKAFKNWVLNEVMQSIEKTGCYPEKAPSTN